MSNTVDVLHGQSSSNFVLVVQILNLEVVPFCHLDALSVFIVDENELSMEKHNVDDFINDYDIDNTLDDYDEEDNKEVTDVEEEGMEVIVIEIHDDG